MSHSLILASTSAYRSELLNRLGLRFEQHAPAVSETPGDGETPTDLAERLAEAKARDVSARHPGAWVIGSDQVAVLDGRILGKPGSDQAAIEQLRRCSGRQVVFHTAVCLAGNGKVRRHLDRTEVRFRELDGQEIERYVAREQPLDCAGGFKAESLGIALFEEITSRDPTALIGLPLIAVAAMLREAGFEAP